MRFVTPQEARHTEFFGGVDIDAIHRRRPKMQAAKLTLKKPAVASQGGAERHETKPVAEYATEPLLKHKPEAPVPAPTRTRRGKAVFLPIEREFLPWHAAYLEERLRAGMFA